MRERGGLLSRSLGGLLASLAIALVSAGIAVATALANPKPDTSASQVEPVDVRADAITSFERSRPQIKRFGGLEFRGGLVLSASHTAFGGWSGLAVDNDGRRFLAVSDAGSWMSGELVYDGTRPKGLRLVRIGPILGLGARALARERDRDAESVVLASGNLARGTVLIAFERTHRIGRFAFSDKEGLGAPLGYLPLPPEARRMTPNKGLESVCLLLGGPHRGAVVALSERYPNKGGPHVGWLQTGKGWTTLSIENIGGYDLVDCAGLPDGGLLVLERRFRWSEMLAGVKSRLRRFGPGELARATGQPMRGEIVLDVDQTQEIDNLEGLAVHTGPRGETVLTLISDDNFNSWMQRTILLQFTLLGPTTAASETPRQ